MQWKNQEPCQLRLFGYAATVLAGMGAQYLMTAPGNVVAALRVLAVNVEGMALHEVLVSQVAPADPT
jgi:hypothetical protein